MTKRPRDEGSGATTEERKEGDDGMSGGAGRDAEPAMGASEFARVMNGDDPRAILRYLKRFVSVVRRERKLSLSARSAAAATNLHGRDEATSTGDHQDDDAGRSSSDDDDESEEDKDDVEESSGNKRRRSNQKDEAWKEDTAQYNVPFVGTSMSKGDTGHVEAGVWPSGFLRAYLQKSPIAIELTSADCGLVPPSSQQQPHQQTTGVQRQNQGAVVSGSGRISTSNNIHKSLLRSKEGRRLSQAIHKAYLKALSELVTAAIPIDKLLMSKRDDLLKQKPRLLQASTAGQSSRPAFDDDGVTGDDGGSDSDTSQRHLITAAASLYARLIGEIVKKRVPGLLHLLNEETGRGKGQSTVIGGCGPLASHVLRVFEALSATSAETARYIARLLEQHLSGGVLRILVCPQQQHRHVRAASIENDGSGNTGNATSRDEARVASIRLATVLVEQHDNVIMSCITTPGAKDRKLRPGLLFLILNDGLSDFTAKTAIAMSQAAARPIANLLTSLRVALIRGVIPKRSLVDLFSSRDCVPHLCRMAVTHAPALSEVSCTFRDVLDAADSYSGVDLSLALNHVGVAARRLLFLLLASRDHSPLLLALEGNETSAKNSEQVIAKALVLLLDTSKGLEIQRFIFHCVSIASGLMSALFCVLTFPDPKKTFAFMKKLNFAGRLLQHVPLPSKYVPGWDETIFPKELKRQHLSKALQTSCPLLVVETTWFMQVALKRYSLFAEKAAGHTESMDETFFQRMPELQVILATISQFCLAKSLASQEVTRCLYEFMRILVLKHPPILRSVTFDWSKLIPSDARNFCSTPLHLQITVLKCLREIISIKDLSKNHGISLINWSLDIMVQTRSSVVYKSAYGIALNLVTQCDSSLRLHGDEAQEDLVYEASCWLNGLTKSTIDEFCSALQESCHHTTDYMIRFAKVWKKSGILSGSIPELNISALLTQCLNGITHASKNFAFLSCQVVMMCLMHHLNPLPLAVITCSLLHQYSTSELTLPARLLLEYANAMVIFSPTMYGSLCSLLKCIFPSKLCVLAMDSFREQVSDSSNDLFPTIRMASHLYTISEIEGYKKNHLKLFFTAIPIAFKSKNVGSYHLSIWPVITRFLGSSPLCHELFDVIICSSSVCEFGGGWERIWMSSEKLKILSSVSDGSMSIIQRKAILSLYMIGEFVPQQSMSEWCESVLKTATEQIAERSTFLHELSSLFLHQTMVTSPGKFSSNLACTVFKSWLSFTSTNLGQEVHRKIVRCLEQMLCKLLSQESPCLVSCSLYKIISQHAESLVKRCISERKTSFLTALLLFDTARFAPLFLKKLSLCDADSVAEMFEDGLLVEALPLLLDFDAGKVEQTDMTAQLLLSDLFIDHAAKLIQSPASTPTNIASALSALQSFEDHNASKCLTNIDRLCHAIMQRVPTSPGQIGYVESSVYAVIVQAATHLTLCAAFDSEVCRAMSGAVLLSLLYWLPHEVHLYFKENCMGDNLKVLLDQVLKLLQSPSNVRLPSFPKQDLIDNITSICVHFGLDSDSHLGIQTKLLSLVLGLLTDQTAACGLSKLVNPQQILLLVLSHTNFASVLGEKNDMPSFVQRKCTLLQIMGSCLYRMEEVEFDEDIWAVLLQGFSAGVSLADTLSRGVMQLYCQRGSKCLQESEVTCMEHLRWSGIPRNDRESSCWGWLVGAVDVRRLQATISNYPIQDKVKVDVARVFGEVIVSQLDVPEKGCERYSPGFLLPLIYCALEDEGSTVDFAKQLSDKGCLALALAAMCSDCDCLRCIALAVIKRLSVILDSEEARRHASWRERPQLDMFLKSLQRALTIRKVQGGDGTVGVKRILGVAAIFLARSSLILARPSDSLYTPINRIFLKNEADHGAFQDLSRLPAFVSLFCSASDEPGLSRQHRLQALRFLKDGITDESCYGALASCHAVELLLSGLDTSRLSESNDPGAEATLILSTLSKLLSRGGQRCYSDLIGRLGLLSWFRTILDGLLFLHVLPTPVSRLSFLELVQTAVTKAEKILPEDELSFACEGLARPVLDLWTHARKGNGAKSLDEMVYTTLCLLGQQSKNEEGIEAGGLALTASLTFLLGIQDPSRRLAALIAVSRLPVCPLSNDLPSLEDFCRLALRTLRGAAEEAEKLQGAAVVMKRVSLLLNSSRVPLADNDCTVILLLLDLRSISFRRNDTQKEWRTVLQSLGKNRNYPGAVINVIQEILQDI